MELDKDFKEFLRLLNQNKVEYLIVGGYAVAFHVKPSGENANNLLKVIDNFGFETADLYNLNFETETIAFHLGMPPIRIDIMNQISGVKFNECYSKRIETEVSDIKVNYINFQDLIQNKKVSGKLKDLNDMEHLQ